LKKFTGLVLIIFVAAAVFAQEEATETKGNSCYPENVTVEKGTSFPVKVFVNNVDTLAGMQVPIYYRSEDVDLKCDSISFEGSRCADFALELPLIEPVGKTAFFAFISMTDPEVEHPPLYPGDGLVATLWFTAPEEVKSGKVELSSGPNAIYPHDKIDYSYLFWTPKADQVECKYVPAYITVK
jgi:hypothetical protein